VEVSYDAFITSPVDEVNGEVHVPAVLPTGRTTPVFIDKKRFATPMVD
jgi:hypothetical protein